MKKNTVKAFTLVEMLIVIVIIGILIASLMPRMQSAQGRARDVARKNDLAQIQTAIITSQQDKRKWPGMEDATEANRPNQKGIPVSNIATLLQYAWMTQVPKDPNKSNTFIWLGDATISNWDYGYMVTVRNSVSNGWFILMAKTEVEWSSNWIVCASNETSPSEGNKVLDKWRIKKDQDLKEVKTCTSFSKEPNGTCGIATTNQLCTYNDESQLRYILMY